MLCGQTANLAPADGKLYALRDVTGTVPSTALIAASVMSKKIASGAQGIVLDVKAGSGAFMATVADATTLARRMVEIGRLAKKQMVALISDMNQPLGCAVGNVLEVREALDTLRGQGPPDFRQHCVVVGAHMLVLAGVAANLREGRRRIEKALSDGSALGKFRELVEAQGGDRRVVDDPGRLPTAPHVETLASPKAGYLARLDARTVGEASLRLGAGRTRKGEKIDHRVGIVVHAKVGDRLRAGDPLFTIHAANAGAAGDARSHVLAGIRFSSKQVKPLPLFYRTLES